jgi:hypothetical protein
MIERKPSEFSFGNWLKKYEKFSNLIKNVVEGILPF